ncbi:MAG: hypothetical protein WDO18_15665 [Acidobacteriota bacterium]
MAVAKAHTDGDSIVFFRRSDVVAAGNLFDMTSYPRIDLAKGGNVQGVLKGLNLILDLCVPKHEQEGGTYVIPGRGRLTDEHDVLEYRDMVTIIRDRIQDGIKKGQTLAQVKAAKPTYEYDARWGSSTGDWTTDMFIEAVYKESGWEIERFFYEVKTRNHTGRFSGGGGSHRGASFVRGHVSGRRDADEDRRHFEGFPGPQSALVRAGGRCHVERQRRAAGSLVDRNGRGGPIGAAGCAHGAH